MEGQRPAIRATRAEIDLGALQHNAAVVARAAGGAAVCAVVKADAYGHGAVPVARALLASGHIAALGVSLIEEGIELRDAGVTAPVLVMGPALDGGHQELVARDLTPVVSEPADLEALAALGRARGRPVPVHLKVDTGMGRLGIPAAAVGALVARAVRAGGVEVAAIATHFACADLDDPQAASSATLAQLAVLDRALADVRAAGAAPALIHAANSAAVFRYPASHFGMVRPGLAMYGNGLAPPAPAGMLEPVMHLVTRIAQVRDVETGQAVSYGALWRAERPSRIAVLPLGYADGYPRRLTGGAEALVGGRRCPVVGAISMDMTLVDVTAHGDDARVGDEVVLLGVQGQERIAAAELAERAGVTEYEVTCGVSKRVPRVYR
ncbi:MAG TPA: alanine racemase [Kofleriaceae bacterium]|nr:alanine racemase [Kofleriaceae bacterium]